MKRLQLETLAVRWCPHGNHVHYEPEPEIPVPETPAEPPALVGPLPGISPPTPPTPVTPPIVGVVGPQPSDPPVTPPTNDVPVDPSPTPSPNPVEPQENAAATEHHEEEKTPTDVRESRVSVDGVLHMHAFTGMAMPTFGTATNAHHEADGVHEQSHDGAEHPPQHQASSNSCGHGSMPMYFVGVHNNTHRPSDDVVTEIHIEPEHTPTTPTHRNLPSRHASTTAYQEGWPTLEVTSEVHAEVQEADATPSEVSVGEVLATVEPLPTNRLQRVLGWCSLSMVLLWAARTVHAKPPAKLRATHATR